MRTQNDNLKPHEIERIEVMDKILTNLSDNFVLKGGTALLLGYGLDRFSEDIDLDVIEPKRSIKQELTHLKIDGKPLDISVKKDTDTTFRVMIDYGGSKPVEGYGESPYNLKLEVSKRSRGIMPSDYTNIDGIQIYNIETLISQKINAFGARNKARDIYDVHFLLQNYNDNFSLDNYRQLVEIMERRDIETISFELETAKREGVLSGIDEGFDSERMALEIDEAVTKGIEKLSSRNIVSGKQIDYNNKPKEKRKINFTTGLNYKKDNSQEIS